MIDLEEHHALTCSDTENAVATLDAYATSAGLPTYTEIAEELCRWNGTVDQPTIQANGLPLAANVVHLAAHRIARRGCDLPRAGA